MATKEKLSTEHLNAIPTARSTTPEIEKLVRAAISESGAAGMQEMGKVMAILKPQLQGRADMGAVSAKIKSLLGWRTDEFELVEIHHDSKEGVSRDRNS